MEIKNVIAGLLLTAALVTVFSCTDRRPAEKSAGYGPGTKRPGESYLVLPGDGDRMAIAEPGKIREQEFATDNSVGDKQTPTVPKMEITTKPTAEEATEKNHTHIKETVCEFYPQIQAEREDNCMNEMIISFWHGVAAVLIGEVSALLVAIAWARMRGGK